jgi:hypothetical protein
LVIVKEGGLAGRAILWRDRSVSITDRQEVREARDIAEAEVVLEMDIASWFWSRRKVWIESSSSPKVFLWREGIVGVGHSGAICSDGLGPFFLTGAKI